MLDNKSKGGSAVRGRRGATPGNRASRSRKASPEEAGRQQASADAPAGQAGQGRPAEPAEPAPRTPGTRDPGRTSAAILAAAVEEFSEMGFGGARIDRIAERAGINKRMLYHYFGDKEALYAHALKEIYLGIRSAEKELRLEAMDPVAGIRKLATFTWDYFLKHPEFLSLLASENLNRAAVLRSTDWGGHVNSPLVEGLADLLRRGADAGQFRRGLDPAEVYVTMTGVGYFALSNRHTLSVAFGRDFGGPGLSEHWGEHMGDVVLAWLMAPERPATSRKAAPGKRRAAGESPGRKPSSPKQA
jgi:AcrR family transcriptional regulator